MNISTEQVFIVNSTEIEPHNHLTPEVSLQRNFTMPVAAIHPEDPQSSGICLPQSSLEPPSRSQTCRLCAAVTDMVVPIFEGEGLQNCLADKIHQHLPIQVSEKDVLPVVMCFQCTSTLLAWHELVICSVQADAVMRERFNQQHQPQPPPTAESSQTQFKQEKVEQDETKETAEPLPREEDVPRTIITTTDGTRKAQCGLCNKIIATATWRRHARQHAKSRKYRCDVCGRAFTDSGNLTRHISAIHSTNRPYSCSHCSRTFTRAQHLQDHERTHVTESRDFICEICGVGSFSSSGLRMHRMQHRVALLSCPQCEARFKRASELRAHVSVHSGERSHACSCGRAFRLRAQLTRHQRTHAADTHPIREDARDSVPCEHCNIRLPNTELRTHVLTAHAHLLFLCAECRQYLARKYMMAHMATHLKQSRDDQKDTESEKKILANSITEQKIQKTSMTRQKLAENSITQIPLLSQANIIPIVRISKVSKLFVTPPPLILNSSAIKPQHGLITNNVQESTTSEPLLKKTTILLEPSEKKTDETNNENTISESNAEINSNDKVRNFKIGERDSVEKQTATVHSKEIEEKDTALTNDFSDQSDTENEFGRLPESVFDAIEDSQDAPSNDSSNSETEKPKTEIKNSKTNLPRPCPVCQKQCTSLSGWYYHIKREHGTNKSITCDACNKIFKSKSDLANHSRTHTKEKPFNCRICESSFSSRAGRYIHEQTHGTKRSHVCDRCPKAFRWKAQLSRHLDRHNVEKSNVCAQCGRAFSVAFDLTRHMRSHNPGCHKCNLCNATFKQKRYLKVHMENIHLRNVVASSSTDATKVCRKSKDKSVLNLSASDIKS